MVDLEKQAYFYALDCTGMPTDELKAYRLRLQREYRCPTHATKDGRIIPVELMKDIHLHNTLNAYIRKVQSLYADSCPDEVTAVDASLMYAEALTCRAGARIITSALARRGYEPTEADLKKLRGMEQTLRAFGSLDHLRDRLDTREEWE